MFTKSRPIRTRCILCAVLALAAACTPLRGAEDPAPMPAAESFERLKTNAPVEWLVRMVAFDAQQPQLEVHHLKSLGGPHEDFTFVADYAELRGYTAADAVHKSGGTLEEGQRVACILFPIANHTIYPASVRGLLQVVQQIDMRRASEPGYRSAPLDVLLTDAERDNLAQLAIESWAWDNYRQDFKAFAAAVRTLRAQKASAIGHIGEIGHDWSEAGCSRWLPPVAEADRNTMTLELPGDEAFTIHNYGVRVFLMRNLPIAKIAGRVLVDFDDPHRDRIPEITMPADAGETAK